MRLHPARAVGLLRAPWIPGWSKDPLWRRARAVPSLDLRFADNKSLVDATTGQNLIDFSRASGGTYVDSQGVIRNATTNLLLRSEEFDNTSVWLNLVGTVARNANATLAPNGTLTADELVFSAADNTTAQNFTITSGVPYTVSLWMKGVPGETIRFTANNIPGGTNYTLTGDWVRYSFTGVSTGTAATFNITTYGGVTARSIYIWGAQLEQSSTVGEYIPTTSSINSAPRFHHDPTTGESLGLLAQESRTNSFLQSEDFSTTWTVNAATIDSNQVVAPDGNITADRFKEDLTATNLRRTTQSAAFVSGQAYTASVFAKYNGRHLQIRFGNDEFTQIRANFDLQNGVKGSVDIGVTADIVDFGNGWYRCIATATAIATKSGFGAQFSPILSTTAGYAPFYTGDGVSGFYLWGAQLEAGSFPTSYIPTEGTTVTRAADVASITGTNFSSWYRQDEGTVFAEARTQQSASGHILAGFSTGSFVNSAYLSKEGDNVLKAAPNAAPSNLGIALSSVSSNVGLRSVLAFTAGTGSASAVMNGGTVGTDASTGIPITMDRFAIGSAPWNIGTTLWNGTIRRLTYWPRRLDNNTLQTITR